MRLLCFCTISTHMFQSVQKDPCYPCCCRIQVQTHPETRYAYISITMWDALARTVGGAWIFIFFSLLLTCLFWKTMQGMAFPLRRCWQGSISRAERASCTGDGLSISGRCLPSYHLSEELHELSRSMLSGHTTLFISVSPFYRGGGEKLRPRRIK